ncbi:MAG: SUMF1/EgtB/PvdO family nonheme iron enzyme [Planctomycetota bacterium]
MDRSTGTPVTDSLIEDTSWPLFDPDQDIVLRVQDLGEGEDRLRLCGVLAGGSVREADALAGRFVVPDGLREQVHRALQTGHLGGSMHVGPRADLFFGLDPQKEGDAPGAVRAGLAAALRSTMPAGAARRRLVLDAPATTQLGHVPLEGVLVDESRPFESGRAELVRYVHVPRAPQRTPYAPFLRRYRAVVLVGDVEQSGRDSGSLGALRDEVQAVVDALRIPGGEDVGAEVLVASVTGSLQIRGAVERALLLDRRGDDEEREQRLRKALSRFLGAAPIDVLHYVGHGEEASDSPVGLASQRVSFSLPLRPGDAGRPRRVWVSGDEVAAWIRRPVRLCTVSACAAAPQLAEALCRAAEHVVVMGARVEPRFAAAWSRALFERLFVEHLPIGAAVATSRDVLRAGEFEGRVWIPRHYARTLDDAAFQDLPFRSFLDRQAVQLGVMEGVQQAWWQPKDEAWIDQVYVEIGLVRGSEPIAFDPDEVDPGRPTTLRDVVVEGPHLRGRARSHFRLVGEAGSGKTTAVRVLARRLAREGRRLPIYVRLPDWEKVGFGLDFLAERGIDEGMLQRHGHDIVLLLDGLDEIDELEAFRATLRKSWFPFEEAALVVAGRSSAGSLGDGFLRIDVAPLSRERAVRLAARVLNVERGQAERDLENPRRRERAAAKLARIGDPMETSERVVEHLVSDRLLRREAEVPLFVTLAALLWAGGVELTKGGRTDFYRQVLHFLVEDRHRTEDVGDAPVDELRAAAQALAVEWIAVKERAFDLFQGASFERRLRQACIADRVVAEDRLGQVAGWPCRDVWKALLRAGLLIEEGAGELGWAHPSFPEALVAEALVELALENFDAVFSLTDDLFAARPDAASAYAEAMALFALGLRSDAKREAWVRHLLERERTGNLDGRLTSRLLWLGVTVSDELAAEVVGATGEWEERFDLFETLDDADADGLVASLGALVRHAHDVADAGARTLRMPDLGYAWCRAEQLEGSGLGSEDLAALRRLVLERLPSPDPDRLRVAFETIGGAWTTDDEERERLAAERSRMAPFDGVDAAPTGAAFWVEVEGTPAGETFSMGADPLDWNSYGNESSPDNGVRLTQYAISSVPVTRGLYRLFDPAPPDDSPGRPDEPVSRITWFEARLFCAWATHWLRHFEILGPDEAIDLPTEAQWEYAARERGSSKGESRFHTGRNEAALALAGWFISSDYGDAGRRVMPVGLLTPATIGGTHQCIWDLHGNVWEWCRNVYAGRLGGGEDPVGPPWPTGKGAGRTLRGGSIRAVPRNCRASYRGRVEPVVDGFGDLGFRLVRTTSGSVPTRYPARP